MLRANSFSLRVEYISFVLMLLARTKSKITLLQKDWSLGFIMSFHMCCCITLAYIVMQKGDTGYWETEKISSTVLVSNLVAQGSKNTDA